MRKQILSTLLALALALSLLPAGALAAEGDDEATAALEVTEETSSDPGSGTVPENSRGGVFAGGDGSQGDPYEIATLEQLKAFRDSVNDGKSYQGQYIQLTADIDLGNEAWTPIGTEGKPFRGTFDGSDHTISNLYIEKGFSNTVSNSYVGLFGLTNDPAVIKNLDMENVDIQGSLYVGAVVGNGYTGKEISNCHISGEIKIDAWWWAGGISGNGYVTTVSGCSVTGDDGSYIRANNGGSYIGGIWGYRAEGDLTISDCSVSGLDVSGTDRVGGISGIAHYQNTIQRCTISDASITTTNHIGNTGLIAGADLSDEANGVARILDCTVEDTTAVSDGVTITAKVGPCNHNGAPAAQPATVGSNVVFDSTGKKITGGTLEQAAPVSFADSVAVLLYAANGTFSPYETLLTAVNAASEGDTIKLLHDLAVTTSQYTEYNLPANAVLDLNGKALTIPYMQAIFQGENITIQNGRISSTADYSLFLGNGTLPTTSVTVRDVSLDCGINAYYAQATLKNVTADASGRGYHAVFCDAGSDITVESGSYTQSAQGHSGLVFGGGDDPEDDPGKLTIAGGSFYGAVGICDHREGTPVSDYLVITGGSFSEDPSAYVPEGCEVSGSGPYTVSEKPAPTPPTEDDDEDSGSTGGGSSTGGSSSSGSGSASAGDKTESTTHPDGSTTTTVTRPDGTVTETTRQPDGSQQVVETQTDGTTTTTVTDAAGNKSETVARPDGSSTTTVEQTDGSASTTTVSQSGQVDAQVTLPEAVVSGTQEKGQTVALPMPTLSASADRESAPTVTVALPQGTAAKVEVPVENVTAGTVAVIVRADGTEEIIKTTLTTDGGVAVTLSDGDTVKIVDNTKTFDDVDEAHWGADAVTFAASRELFQGTSETTFDPDTAMSRGMIVTVLARFDGVDTSAGASWYEAGVQWAVEAGISDGSGLDQPLTREQLATMLHRYAGSPAVTGGADAFPDAGSVSDFAADAMAWAVENGLISGMGDGTLAPQGQATRVQVAAILQRFVACTA